MINLAQSRSLRRPLWVQNASTGRVLLACLWLGAGIVALHGVSQASADTLSRMPLLFWLTVCAYVAIHPIADLMIFRLVWGRQAGMLAAVTRRFVGNELLFGYAGETYLFAWAHHRKIRGALHAVKDVAILSAFVGHVIALLLPLLALRGVLGFGITAGQLGLSVGCIVALSVTMLMLRGRLLKLSRYEMRFISSVHLMRSVAMIALVFPLWMVAAPTLGFGTCIVLVAIRQFVSRLPLVPGKDLIFAAIIVAMHGAGDAAVQAVTVAAIGIMGVEAVVAIGLAALTLAAKTVEADDAIGTPLKAKGGRKPDIALTVTEIAATLPEIVRRTIIGIGLEPPMLSHGQHDGRLHSLFDQMVESGLLVGAACSDGTTFHLTRLGRAVSDIVLQEYEVSYDLAAIANSTDLIDGYAGEGGQAIAGDQLKPGTATSRKTSCGT